MAFGGESIRIDWANWMTGTEPSSWNWGWEFNYRRDEYATTIVSGDSFIAGFYNYADWWENEEVEASLVFVCGPSSAGSIGVSVGPDPDWDLENPALATQSLGPHAVSGAMDVVIPIPVFDQQGFYDYDYELAVLVECLSGQVEIQQIKLRLWPPGGPQGAWAEAPGETWESSPGRIMAEMDVYARGESGGTIEDAYNEAYDGPTNPLRFVGREDLAVRSANAVAVLGNVERDIQDGAYFIDNQVILDLAYVHVSAGGLASPYGWPRSSSPPGIGRHPDEVRGEPGASVVSTSGEVLYPTFGGWTRGLVVRVDAGGSMSSGGVLVRRFPATTPSIIAVNSDVDPLPMYRLGTSWYYVDGAGKVPLSGRPYVWAGGGQYDLESPEVQEFPLELPNSSKVECWLAPFSWYSRALENYWISGSGGNIENWKAAAQMTLEVPSDLKSITSVPDHLYWNTELPWVETSEPVDTAIIPGYLISPNPNLDGLGLGVEVTFSQ